MFGLKPRQVSIINAAAIARPNIVVKERPYPSPNSGLLLPSPKPKDVERAMRMMGNWSKKSGPVIHLPGPPMLPPLPQRIQSRMKELAEYYRVAALVGVVVPDIMIEQFKAVLEGLDYPIYDNLMVKQYMDDKCRREGKPDGWKWLPLREKDRFDGAFGKIGFRGERTASASSDGYAQTYAVDSWEGRVQRPTRVYSKVVPLHALSRVAAIEARYPHPVHFLVNDYEALPAFRPDPFLLAVIPNSQLDLGVGRFVIDFWDEPGFGIKQMIGDK